MTPKGPSMFAALGAVAILFLLSRSTASAATVMQATDQAPTNPGAPVPDQATALQEQQNGLLSSILRSLATTKSSSTGTTTSKPKTGPTSGGPKPTPPKSTGNETSKPITDSDWWHNWAATLARLGAPFRDAASQGIGNARGYAGNAGGAAGGSLTGWGPFANNASGGFNSGGYKYLQLLDLG